MFWPFDRTDERERFDMKLMTVFLREINAPSHRCRLYRERGTGAFTALVALAALLTADRFGFIDLGKTVRTLPFGGIIPALLLVMGLSRASALLSVDRREGTLPLLLLTHLSGFDIVCGKVLHALATEVLVFLAIVPTLVLPLAAAGFNAPEFALAVLGSLNIIFYGLALGIFASVWADGPKATAVCLLLLLPPILYAGPIGFILPGSGVRRLFTAMDWATPLAALAHLGTAAAGVHPGAYWWNLATSHAIAWGWLLLAGMALPRAVRWQLGWNLERSRSSRRRATSRSPSVAQRARLLDVNPFSWLCNRRRWPSVKMWATLMVPSFAWGALALLTWAGPGVNAGYIFAIAIAMSWALALLAGIPAEAAYQLVEDRNSGALELLLCTPTNEQRIISGIWLDLRRRYLGPLMTVLFLSLAMAIGGYLTQGFGGMLDADDLPTWLVGWLTGIVFLPIMLVSLCWVAMRRALFVRNAGEASAIACFNVIVLPAFGVGLIFSMMGNSAGFGGLFALLGLFLGTVMLRARYARVILFAQLRQAAASRYSPESSRSRLTAWNFVARVATAPAGIRLPNGSTAVIVSLVTAAINRLC